MKKYFLSLLLMIAFGCELIVDIDVPLSHRSITLNSYFTPDSVWTARLKLNRHVLSDDPFETVEGATVIIYDDETPIDTLEDKGNGLYKSDTGKPVAGKTYAIKAVSDKYGTVSSSSYVPDVPENFRASINSSQTNATGNVFTIIDLNFNDNVNEKNYYKISLLKEYERFGPGGTLVTERTPGTLKIRGESNDDDYGSDEIILSDLLFNGQSHSLQIETWGELNFPKVIISICSISEDYYNYRQTSDLQGETSGNPFAQPVNVYNNIVGGFGIFAGYSQAAFIKENPKPIITSISPLAGKIGDHITIKFQSGNQFTSYVQAYFNSSPQPRMGQPVRLTQNEFEVIVPQNATSGKIVLFVNGVPALSDEVFEVIN